MDQRLQSFGGFAQRLFPLAPLGDIAGQRQDVGPPVDVEFADAQFHREGRSILPAVCAFQRAGGAAGHLPPQILLGVFRHLGLDLTHLQAQQFVTCVAQALTSLLVDIDDRPLQVVQEHGIGGADQQSEAPLALPQHAVGAHALGDVLDHPNARGRFGSRLGDERDGQPGVDQSPGSMPITRSDLVGLASAGIDLGVQPAADQRRLRGGSGPIAIGA